MIELKAVQRKDLEILLSLIKELSVYEKMENDVVATTKLLDKWIFEKDIAKAILAYYDNKPVGFAVYFFNFSTFLGKAGLYLEDLFVKENYRGKKIGITLFKELVKIAAENDLGRMEWSCLKWNKPSIEFYEKLGAFPMGEWDTYRLTEDKFAGVLKSDSSNN